MASSDCRIDGATTMRNGRKGAADLLVGFCEELNSAGEDYASRSGMSSLSIRTIMSLRTSRRFFSLRIRN
jgi:hypothetical protein